MNSYRAKAAELVPRHAEQTKSSVRRIAAPEYCLYRLVAPNLPVLKEATRRRVVVSEMACHASRARHPRNPPLQWLFDDALHQSHKALPKKQAFRKRLNITKPQRVSLKLCLMFLGYGRRIRDQHPSTQGEHSLMKVHLCNVELPLRGYHGFEIGLCVHFIYARARIEIAEE